ncbi:MAG: DMT family transporter [Actinomycetota bacterium]|nr:DMT family transporter [Actinomycetota bacterium]MEC9128636.1 DMT family transporter [Actinomycetota bacterium]MEC9179805.1 DMT family transporter [Actinomycetota bacterium]MEC9212634.1 DMT family transporter [Actinomycetota bacterium]MED5528704.1 DMT family transporter [Actinomycetota bacterium]
MSDGSAPPSGLSRPPAPDVMRLGVAVVFISLSGPMIAATAAPVLAIAFWRCLIGSGITGVWVIARRWSSLGALTRREIRLTVIAGVFLGLHFATWIPSLTLTTIAASTALVATQPIWAALIARAMGVRISSRVWIGIAIAFSGVIVLTGVDLSVDPAHLWGDALALVGAVFSAAYVSVAERVRKTVDTSTTTFVLYAVSAVTILPLVFIFGQQLVGFDAQAWALILAVTLGAQLLGHSMMTRVLSSTSATVVSLAILFEMPGATLVAAIWLGQVPPLALLPAAGLILAGLVIVIKAADRGPAAATVTETSPM